MLRYNRIKTPAAYNDRSEIRTQIVVLQSAKSLGWNSLTWLSWIPTKLATTEGVSISRLLWSKFGVWTSWVVLGRSTVLKSLRECEKWILYKILHRSSGPKKNSTQFFSTKKIILKKKCIFFKFFDFLRKIFFFEDEKISSSKKYIFSKIEMFEEKKFFFSKYFFFVEKIWVEKKFGPLDRL